MILSGGVNIYPAEIEGALSEMREIRDSAVFGVPHPEFGESIVAIIETDVAITPNDIKEFLKKPISQV